MEPCAHWPASWGPFPYCAAPPPFQAARDSVLGACPYDFTV